MTTTVRELSEKVRYLYDSINVLRDSISDSYTKITTGETSAISATLKLKSQIRDLQEEADKYDTEFRKQERFIQSTGGKTRHQTLQEFVILFFYTAFVLLTVSLAVYAYITSQTWINPLKIIGLMLFIGLLTTAIILRYA